MSGMEQWGGTSVEGRDGHRRRKFATRSSKQEGEGRAGREKEGQNLPNIYKEKGVGGRKQGVDRKEKIEHTKDV
jgi:hypothetical protein